MAGAGSWDLITAYTVYLSAATVLNVTVRIRHNIRWTRFLLGVPKRWPHLYRELKAHRDLLLNWPTRAYVMAAFTLLALLLYARFVVYPHARLSADDLADRPGLLALVGVLGAAVAAVDAAILRQAPGYAPEAYARELASADRWLGSWWARVVRGLARRRLRRRLATLALSLNRWLGRRVLQFGLQATLALVLWALWLRSGSFVA